MVGILTFEKLKAKQVYKWHWESFWTVEIFIINSRTRLMILLILKVTMKKILCVYILTFLLSATNLKYYKLARFCIFTYFLPERKYKVVNDCSVAMAIMRMRLIFYVNYCKERLSYFLLKFQYAKSQYK